MFCDLKTVSSPKYQQIRQFKVQFYSLFLVRFPLPGLNWGRGRMVVGFTTTCANSVYHH